MSPSFNNTTYFIENLAEKDITEYDRLKTKLRTCFYSGTFLPEYCKCNGIKKPLFVSDDNELIWEIYVQFKFDKTMIPSFCTFNDAKRTINYDVYCVASGINTSSLSQIKAEQYDSVFILYPKRFVKINLLNIKVKIIFLDDFLNELIRYCYFEKPIINFINKHNNDVKFVAINFPLLRLNEYSTERERFIATKSIHLLKNELQNNKQKDEKEPIKTRFDIFGYSNQEILDMLLLSGATTDLNGVPKLIDNHSKVVNIRDGIRETAYQEDEYTNTIYCIGTCIFFGIGAPYDRTIESYMQKISNENGHKYKIVNASQFYAGRYQDAFYCLNNLPLKQDDIIIFCAQGILSKKFPFIDIKHVFDRPHNYGEVFSDMSHLTEKGNSAIASHIWTWLNKNNFLKNIQLDKFKCLIPHRYGIPEWADSTVNSFNNVMLPGGGVKEFKENLRKQATSIGAIVMNCNPFTKGHRYLIEYAHAQVSYLYVFVVEEDKSFFPFKDRIELVKQGTKDLKNVKVLPSGKFMISSYTFSDYFNKSEIQDKIIDPTFDVELFGREIAPVLGINVRFAGAEPLDAVTAQYNQTMAKVLQKFGVRFEEIPRKELNGSVISASRVRKLLEVGDFAAIKEIVPPTTYEYLVNKFIKQKGNNNMQKNLIRLDKGENSFNGLDYKTGGFCSRFASVTKPQDLPENNKFAIKILKAREGYGFILQKQIPITQGKMYTVSCYARGNGVLRFAFDGTTTRNIHDFELKSEKEWQKCSFNYVKTDGPIQGLHFQNYAGGENSWVEICDISLHETIDSCDDNVCK